MEVDKLQSLMPDQLLHALMDGINVKSIKFLGNILVCHEGRSFFIEEDYRDAIDSLITSAAESPWAGESEDKPQARSEPGNGWDALWVEMENRHRQTLGAILSATDRKSALRKIADSCNTMPELLIEEINELSLKHIGDILVDGCGDSIYILPEHVERTMELLNGTKSGTDEQ